MSPTANQVRYHLPPLAKPRSPSRVMRTANTARSATLSQKSVRMIMSVSGEADHRPPRHGEPGARDERLDLDQHGSASLERREHGGTGRADRALREEGCRGVRHLDQAALPHLEDRHLVGRAEAVLDGAQYAERVRAVALEVEDGVDQVLEDARAGERTLLGDVSDQKAGDGARLR